MAKDAMGFYHGDYEWTMRMLNVSQLCHDGIDMSTTAHVTLEVGDEEYVTVIMTYYDGHDVEVWKTDKYGNANVYVEAPNDMPDYDAYGYNELTFDPSQSPDRIESLVDVDLDVFLATVAKYRK